MSRYCPDIGADIANIGSNIGKNDMISCLDDTISENAISGQTLILVRVLSRYRGLYRDIISRLVLIFFSRQVLLQGTNTMIQMMMMMMILTVIGRWKTSIVCQIKSASCSPRLIGLLCTGTSSKSWNSRKKTLE
jgi:hypothetical protein